MTAEQLVAVEIRVPAERAETAIARLLDLAPGGFEERGDGGEVVLTVYGPRGGAAALTTAFPGARVTDVTAGWEDAWKAFHRPVVVGGIWVGPPWETPLVGTPSVVIDPGRAFGTGAHPTTRLCIELLARTPRGSLLDVGCGSGVLSIAAARLGFGPLVAVDNDPVAVEVTAVNAHANGVELAAAVVDGVDGMLPSADVAVTNILLPAVTLILPRLDVTTAVTSGYLDGERPVAPGWTHVDRAEADGWAADRFIRTREGDDE